MNLCANAKCRAPLTRVTWGEGYCSYKCAHDCVPSDMVDADVLHDPSDPSGQRVIAKTQAEISSLIEASHIDKRLPKILYLRMRGMSNRKIAKEFKRSHEWVAKILKKLPRNILEDCGLRKKR